MARRRPARPPTAIIGAGHLARALLPLLRRAGYRVTGIAARRLAAARTAAGRRGGIRATTAPGIALEGAELVLLAVSDSAVPAVARRLAGLERTDWAGRVVLHHSGALGTDVLEPLVARGAAVGLLHPLQCLGDPRLAARVLPGSRARIEGQRRAAAVARRLARDLGLVPLVFAAAPEAADRKAYHAAASLVSNDLVALIEAGVEVMQTAGLDRETAIAALLPLAAGTLRHVEALGPAGALTGPVPRGDVETLRAHLSALSPMAGTREIHRLLCLRLAALAERQGADVTDVRRVLAPAGRRRKDGL